VQDGKEKQKEIQRLRGEKCRKKAKKKGKKKGKKQKRKLTEHTSFKNLNKKKTKKRQPVWVKKFTLEYEEDLNKLQIELLKWQKHVIACRQRRHHKKDY
jgi:hypothetical protein